MYFTRTDDTFRGWFQLVRTNGELRVDSLPDKFTTFIVNSGDTAFVTASVTQSLQKQGLYYFDITSSFLGTHGVGEYGVSVEVNETTSPKIITAFSKVLRVHENDFDTILSGGIQCVVTGQLTASLSQESIDTMVSGVWNAQTSSFTQSGSFGEAISNIEVSVSCSGTSSFPSGALDSLETKVCEIWQILGLEPGSPMTVTTKRRMVAAITQSISGDSKTSVTVERL